MKIDVTRDGFVKMEHPIIPETYSAIGMNKLWVALMLISHENRPKHRWEWMILYHYSMKVRFHYLKS